MTFEVGCVMVSCVMLALLYLLLDKRVARLEKLLSETLRVSAPARVPPHGTDEQ